MPFCVYVHVCSYVCMLVGTCMCVQVEPRGLLPLRYSSGIIYLVFWDRASPWHGTPQLGWTGLAFKPQGFIYLWPTSTGITSACHVTWLLYLGSADQIVLHASTGAFYSLSYYLSCTLNVVYCYSNYFKNSVTRNKTSEILKSGPGSIANLTTHPEELMHLAFCQSWSLQALCSQYGLWVSSGLTWFIIPFDEELSINEKKQMYQVPPSLPVCCSGTRSTLDVGSADQYLGPVLRSLFPTLKSMAKSSCLHSSYPPAWWFYIVFSFSVSTLLCALCV